MKKFFALLLAMTMLLSVTGSLAAALAEEEVQIQSATRDFDVTMSLPEGYKMTESRLDGQLLVMVEPESGEGTYMSLSIAQSEEYEGRSIADLSEDELDVLLDVMDEDFYEAEIHKMTTEYGTDVYLFNEVGTEDASFATGFTVYQGYFINIYVMPEGSEKLTQADLDMGLKILSEMWFVENK